MTVSGSSNSTAFTSDRTRPRPSEIFCLASAVSPRARRLMSRVRSSMAAISSTRAAICAFGMPRFFSGKARFSATVMVS